MTFAADIFTIVFVAGGAFFFLAGKLGLIRFPDTLSRLHALSKADNLGLGLIILGLLPQAGSIAAALKLVAVWALAQLTAATAGRLMAAIAHRDKSTS